MNLDSREEIAKIDTQNVYGSVEALPEQILHAWKEASTVDVPETYKQISNVVMCGMGGSGLGARVIESVYFDKLRVPLTRVNDYHLPSYVGENSLVFCSSYSGSTEETLKNIEEAFSKNAKVMAIGTGGKLIDVAKENSIPYYQINPQYNPSNQPRMAIGYSVIGQLVLGAKAGLYTISEQEINELVTVMKSVQEKNAASVPESENEAKKLAQLLKEKHVMNLAGGHLVGAMHTVNNQLNENAKTFSADYTIPELNHHLMEGLKHPESNKDSLFAFFAESGLYEERLQKRFAITEDVVSKNNIASYVYTVTASTKLAQSFELIQFGAFVNLYLSLLYDQDPAPIPWVDYFKEQLKT